MELDNIYWKYYKEVLEFEKIYNNSSSKNNIVKHKQ